MSMPMWKKSLACVALGSSAVVGVAGVAAATPAPPAPVATSAHPSSAVTLPKELRDAQNTDQKTDIAFHKSVKLRIINNANAWLNVTDHGAKGIKELSPGDHYDVSGWSFWAGHPDATADLQMSDHGDKVPVWGYNPEIGWPSAGVGGSWQRYGVGDTHTYKTDGGFNLTVTRMPDEDMKLFTMVVTR